MKIALVLLAFTAITLNACSPETSCLDKSGSSCRDRTDEDDAAKAAAAATTTLPAPPMCTTFGQPHIGLGGIDLAATTDGPASGDRARAKPYTALTSEYARVLGTAPELIQSTGPTFGIPQDRWFLEPITSAVFVSTAFNVAFQGCGKLIEADSKYETAPTKESARTECAAWAKKFWSRDATPDQLDACVASALDTTSEGAKRGWTYACAGVLTSTPFLTF